MKPTISINQLAEFSKASLSKRNRIIKQQIKPDKFLIPWYQRAKGAIRRYFKDVNDFTPIFETIDQLSKKTISDKKRAKVDTKVSIEALKKMILLRIPKLLKDIHYDIIRVTASTITVRGVEIKVTPEIIIKAEIDNKTIYGAIKIHVSKNNIFDSDQARLVAVLVNEFLRKKVINKGEIVLPELCFCLDVFSERLVGGDSRMRKEISEIEKLCDEISLLWKAA